MQALDARLTAREVAQTTAGDNLDAEWLTAVINDIRAYSYRAKELREYRHLPSPVPLTVEQVDRFFFSPEQPKGRDPPQP